MSHPTSETYDDRFWQEGVAGPCNIVRFNGEDVRGVAYVADAAQRAAIIKKHNETVRQALQSDKV